MKAITGDNRYVEVLSDYDREELISMCEVLDKFEAQGEININKLYAHLNEIGRSEDAIKAFNDEQFREELKQEFAGKY